MRTHRKIILNFVELMMGHLGLLNIKRNQINHSSNLCVGVVFTGRTCKVKNRFRDFLANNKAQNIWHRRSWCKKSHQGEGFNGSLQGMSFEDQVDNEKVYLHAQKDLESDVLNDTVSHIGHDHHTSIDNDRFTKIGGENGTGNDHLTIHGESRHKISKDHTIIIDGSLQQKVGKISVLDSGKEIHLKSGIKTVIEAGSEMTIKAGGSFIKIDASGVHVVGSAINLNSGGSAGSGSGFSGKLAELPLGAVSPEYSADLEAAKANQAPDAPAMKAVPSTPKEATQEKTEADSSQEKVNSILKSGLLKPLETLEKLANGQGSSYKKV